MTQLDADALLEALDPDQQAVARQVTGPLAVLAGAGTGKTRAITYRIAYAVASGVYPADSVLAVTFTRRAAFEMRYRLAQLGVPKVQARTFHSAALRQAQHFWPSVIGGPMPPIIAHKASMVSSAAARLGITADKTLVRDIASEIEWAKVSLIDSAHYEQALATGREAPGDLSADQMANLLDMYEEAKEDRGVLDFEDVLVILCGMLQERSDVAKKIRAQYRHFVVDEFQDVSPLQRKLLDLWLGGRHDVCVVGDVAQTIYSFAGADPQYLLDFAREHRGTRIVRLTRDYRSTPQIVSLANSVMARAAGEGAVHLESQRPDGPDVAFTTYDTDAAEADGVASRVEALIEAGTPPHEIAVLMRTNAQSQLFEAAFAQKNIPVVISGAQPFFQRPDVRNAMRVLITASKFKGADAEPPQSLFDAVCTQLEAVGWTNEPPAGEAAQERWANLNAILSWAEDSAAKDLPAFVAQLQERAEYELEPDKQGVELTTLHAAKGLEWGAVFLVGVAEGLLPISYAQTPSAVEEERRLLYVGVTRAKDILEVSWAKARTEQGRGLRQRSKLLEGIWPSGAGRKVRSVKESAKDAERAFVVSACADEVQLYEALKAWRSVRAKAAGQPAFRVFPNETLRHIVTERPESPDALLRVKGIGHVKAELFGADILTILSGGTPELPQAADDSAV